jgi:hypothetical protein
MIISNLMAEFLGLTPALDDGFEGFAGIDCF